MLYSLNQGLPYPEGSSNIFIYLIYKFKYIYSKKYIDLHSEKGPVKQPQPPSLFIAEPSQAPEESPPRPTERSGWEL